MLRFSKRPKKLNKEELEVDIETPIDYEKEHHENTNYKRTQLLARLIGHFTGLLIVIVVCYWLTIIYKLFIPQCPQLYGRVCNNQGVCDRGVCRCNTLYSGENCGENFILGYIPTTGQECSAHGFASPFINTPSYCYQNVTSNNLRVGGGWSSQPCIDFVNSVRDKIRANNNNPSTISNSSNIPLCICNAGFQGMDCSVRACPTDENGVVCGGNGNRSVGLFNNNTLAGSGCQCLAPFSFFEPEYYAQFSDTAKEMIRRYYYTEFSTLYCGRVYQATNQLGEVIPDVLLAFTSNEDYQCFCRDNWKGLACTEGKCPINPQTKAVCNNRGDPFLGQGRLENTTITEHRGRQCEIICTDGYENCGDTKCVYTQLSTTPILSKSGYCNSPIVCPNDRQLRCYDSTCVPIPTEANHQCQLGFEYGSVDYGQIGQIINDWKCANITGGEEFTACFANTTIVQGPLNYSQIDGVMWDNSYSIDVDLGSPLVYYQFVINTTGVIVTTWNGDSTIFNTTGFISGFFQYNYTDEGNWIIEDEDGLFTTTLVNDLYQICPMPWNYSGSVSFPANYTTVRLSDPVKDLIYVFDSSSSSIKLSSYTNQPYILINTTSITDTPLWLHPLGKLVSPGQCLSNPTECSWYVTSDNTQVRSLNSQYYLCVSDGVPIIQTTACGVAFSTYKTTISNSLWYWVSCLNANPRIELPLTQNSFTILERNYTSRTTWPFSIQFLDAINTVTLLQDVTFLPLNRVTYPCACDPGFVQQNQSVYNNIWYEENELREANYDSVSIGDYLLAVDYSEGDKRFVRGKVVSLNEISETYTVQDPITSEQITNFKRDVRRISLNEVLKGSSNPNLLLQPFRCPDGSSTTASSIISEIMVDCNCTTSLDNALITTCDCTNLQPAKFGCECNAELEACQCGLPATPDFERAVWDEITSLKVEGCQCLIYKPSVEDLTNNSLTLTNGLTNETTFLYNIEQIPTHIIVKTIGSGCNDSTTRLFAGGELFINLTTEFYGIESNTDCEHWITLYLPQDPAFNNITVISDGVIDWATILFSTQGFSLFQTATPPTFTASSNSDDAGNINILNASYWESSTAIQQLPVWIEATMHTYSYIDYTTFVFYKAGVVMNSIEYPLMLYFQGEVNNQWINLGNVSVYVEEGGWAQRSIAINNTQTFRKFRLITNGGGFSLRQWWIYSNQQCRCNNGESLMLRFDSLDGLPTIASELEEIQYFYDHINTKDCVCENNCTMTISGGIVGQFANNGVCEDAYYQATIVNLPRTMSLINSSQIDISLSSIVPLTALLYTVGVFEGIDCLQVALDSTYFISREEQVEFYENYLAGDTTPNFPNPDLLDETQFNLTIWYMYSANLTVIPPTEAFSLLTTTVYTNGTYNMTINTFEFKFGDLVENGLACTAGMDCADCGPYIRDEDKLPGYTCTLTYAQYQLLTAMENGTIYINKTYYVSNLTALTGQWSATWQNIRLPMKVTQLQLDNCPEQTCASTTPVKCANGRCVQFPSQCDNRNNCPGDGCVTQTDASTFGNDVYRCACSAGNDGDGCQFDYCLGATPYLKVGVPGANECVCGGPPPLRELPPIVNIGQEYTTAALIEMNNRVTGNSAPKSPLDVDYLRIMPQNGPWGRVIRRTYVGPVSGGAQSKTQRSYYTTCPFARKGFRGEYILLPDDVISRDPLTNEITEYREYLNPATGEFEIFPWPTSFAYDDFSFRCKNAQCVESEIYCAQSELLFPLCNGRGRCRGGGICECYAGWRTFSITTAYTCSIKYPYVTIDCIPNPTIWEMNWNWKHHGLNQCTARDCTAVDCSSPKMCFPGTVEKNFNDALVLCSKSTGRENRCAPTLSDCRAGLNLAFPLVCSGNGIPRVKDFTGETYCVCGDPISSQVNITELTQITQIKPNGWGGPYCNQYYATTAPILWSSWNFELDEPHRSIITGEALPGIWISGVRIMGPDPDDKLVWDQCCAGYDRLESCPSVACNVLGDIVCKPAGECTNPLIYACNNHGVARQDGTCECDQDVGEGYTYDYTQFSVKGCYKFVQCPLSAISGKVCNYVESCSEPGKWIHPLPYDKGIDDQWWICGLEAQGIFSDLTRLRTISANINQFTELILNALSDIALSVLESIAGLQSCICVYPDDTASDKCCMVAGSSYTYKQNYAAPDYLNGGVVGYPNLTDGSLEERGEQSSVFESGSSFDFILNNNDSTSLSAVRLFGKKVSPLDDVTVTFYSGATMLCAGAVHVQNETSDYLYWMIGTGTAAYCGPTYTCYNYRSLQPTAYSVNCIVPTSLACLQWKQDTCNSIVTNEYWPTDSLAVYQGCNRDADNDGCTCCQLVSLLSSNVPITTGVITTVVSGGALRIGQVEFFGHTDSALDAPLGLTQYINTKLTEPTTCQDYKFYADPDYLGPDKTLYTPTLLNTYQQTASREDAMQLCNYTGGYLATSDTVSEGTGQNMFLTMQRACGRINSTATKCWVNARDILYNDAYVDREDLFEDGCTTCYEPDRWYVKSFPQITNPANTVTFSFKPLSFSDYPYAPTNVLSTKYKVATFSPSQVSTLQALNNMVGTSPPYAWDSNNIQNGIYIAAPRTSDACVVTLIKYGFYGDCSYTMTFPAGDMNQYGYGIDLTSQTTSGPPSSAPFSFQCTCVQWNFAQVRNEFVTCSQSLSGWSAVKSSGNCARIAFYRNSDCKTPGFMTTQGNTQGPGEYGSSPLYIVYNQGMTANGAFPRFFPTANTPSTIRDVIGNLPINLERSDATCLRVFPPNPFYTFIADARYTQKDSTGTYGTDWMPGVRQYEYLPAFISVSYLITIDPVQGRLSRYFEPYITASTPVYFTELPLSSLDFRTSFTSTTLTRCSQCQKTIVPHMAWYEYAFQTVTWPGLFTTALTESIQIPTTTGYVPLSLTTLPLATFVHQITYIESVENTQNSASRQASTTVDWKLNGCLIVTPNGAELSVCEGVEHNYICRYAFTKFTVVSGYQCDPCGPNSRSGGAPAPGVTCYDEFPLANETAFPLQWQIKNAYVDGTLEIYAESFNLPQDDLGFGNVSTIWGFEQAWLKWKNKFSNRAGFLTRGVLPQEDWCNLNIDALWPVDCGIQRDPITNVRVRRCASNIEYCNLKTTLSENAIINTNSIPPIYGPISSTISANDKTCGFTVSLKTYNQVDRYGAAQDDLDLYVVILSTTILYVQLQINSAVAKWYNAGKAVTPYVFTWNTTSTIAGSYTLTCVSCTDAIMEVFIAPKNIEYTFPSNRLSQNVTLTAGVLTTFSVDFTVTESDTGVYYSEGEAFPTTVFRVVGFIFYNLDIGSSIYLYNPVITNDDTRAECENRTTPTLYETKTAIESTAPIRQCILTDDDKLLFPGKDIGECACDLSSAGRTCDCVSVLSKYGPAVCGGYGDEGTRIRAPDGTFYITGTGTEAGCFVYTGYSDCKTIDIGRWAWTLQVEGATWNYPSVFVDVAPQDGNGLFINPNNPLQSNFDIADIEDLCVDEAARLVYYNTPDELNQLVRKNLGILPVFMSIGTVTQADIWPWDSNIDDSYFINGLEGTYLGADGAPNCAFLTGICEAINFNNYAYGTTGDFLTDGNAIVSGAVSIGGTITWDVNGPLEVYVYIFSVGVTYGGVISCSNGGFCETVVLHGLLDQSYVCRCPSRQLSYSSGGEISEIQIFRNGDLMTSGVYTYS